MPVSEDCQWPLTGSSREQAANFLRATATVAVPVIQIASDLESKARQIRAATTNQMHYAAWLVEEMGGHAK